MKNVVYEEIFRNELTHAWYLGTRKLMLSEISKIQKSQPKILDAGCGTGGAIKFLQNEGFKNVYGVDNSPTAIKFAKQRVTKNIKLASVNQLPFPDNTFDIVICLDVLYHRKTNPGRALKEFNRVLKKGGVLYLQEPAYKFLRGNHDIMIETGRRFLKGELINLAEHTGFRVKKSTYFNSIFLLPIIIKRLFEKKISRRTPQSDVKPLNPVLNKVFLKTLVLEMHLTDYFNFPFGLSIILIGEKK